MPTPTITLGGVTLSPSMAWSDRDIPQSVEQSVRRTLGGGTIIEAAAVSGGRDITLASSSDMGLLSWVTVQAVKALAEQAGAVFLLDIDGQQFNVMFRHHDAPAFIAEPLMARPVPFDDDYFRCTIKLITV